MRRRRATRTSATRSSAASCAQCHGKDATGGGSAPTLNSSQFLKSTTDDQIFALVSGGVSGTEMPAWSLDYGGTFTDEQVRQVVTYLRSLEPTRAERARLAPGRHGQPVERVVGCPNELFAPLQEAKRIADARSLPVHLAKGAPGPRVTRAVKFWRRSCRH